MATTLNLEPPSTTFLNHQNSPLNTKAQTSSKSTVLSRLCLLGSELKEALPKPPKRKRKQASASTPSSSEGMEEKPTSSPMKTEAIKQEEIIQIQSPTSSKSTKSTILTCLPLKNILVLKRKQASPKGQGLEEILPPPSKEEAIQTQSPTLSNSTKKTIPSYLSLKNIFVLERKHTLPSKEPEDKVLPSSSEEKPPSSSVEEEHKPFSSEEEEKEQKPPSSSEEEQKPPSSSDEDEEEEQQPPSSEEEEEQKPASSEEQKPPSSTSGEEATKTQSHTPSNSTTTTIPSCFSLKNILVPKTKQVLSSKGLKEKLASSSSEVKLPSSSEEGAIQTLSPNPSNSTKKTIPSCLSLKNILVPKRKQALSSKLEEKMPSSSSSEEAIQTPPSSSSEPAPTVDDKHLVLPTMSTEKKYKIVRSVGEECTEEAELQDLPNFWLYSHLSGRK